MFLQLSSMKETTNSYKKGNWTLYSNDAFLGAFSLLIFTFLSSLVTAYVKCHQIISLMETGELHSTDLWHCTRLVVPKVRIRLVCPQSPTVALSAPSGSLCQ